MRSLAAVRKAALATGILFTLANPASPAAEAQRAPAPATPTSASTPSDLDPDTLYAAGRQLFEQLAPPEVKAQYEFPSPAAWNDFAARLQRGLDTGSFDELARYAPEARAALAAMRGLGADDDLADWLEQRLDELEAARDVPRAAPVPRPPEPSVAPPNPARPPSPPRAVARSTLPYYDWWVARVRNRPTPASAGALMPVVRSAFAAEGVPSGLGWIAEAESSLNPNARSPAGAKGLFQLMPDTARTLGLGTMLPDERTNPEKSAHAAAKYLRELHGKFGDWPLTLAAYNAGEGRVSRLLAARRARDFATIADGLPAETRMYVPKVCALVAVRSGTSLTQAP